MFSASFGLEANDHLLRKTGRDWLVIRRRDAVQGA
jgi:hypothetical protein